MFIKNPFLKIFFHFLLFSHKSQDNFPLDPFQVEGVGKPPKANGALIQLIQALLPSRKDALCGITSPIPAFSCKNVPSINQKIQGVEFFLLKNTCNLKKNRL